MKSFDFILKECCITNGFLFLFRVVTCALQMTFYMNFIDVFKYTNMLVQRGPI